MKLPFKIHQSFYFALGILVMKSVSLLMLPIVTRYLAPVQFGELEFLLSISDFATILVGFGLVDALYRFGGLSLSAQDERQIGATVFSLSMISGVVSLVLGLVIAPLVIDSLPGQIKLFDLQLLVVLISVDALLLVPLSWLKMKDHAFSFFILTTGKAIAQAVISWQLLEAGYGITAMLLGGAISSLILVAILAKIQYDQTGFRIVTAKIGSLLHYGSPLVISAIAGYAMLSADRWMITAFASANELGLYAVGKKLVLLSVILMQPFLLWWLPRRFKVLQTEGNDAVAYHTSLGIALVICFSTLICLASPLVIKLLIHEQFAGAMDYVPAMALLFAIKQVAELANFGCYIGQSTWQVMKIDLVTAAIALVGLFVLGQQWQVKGVIIALLVAQSIRGLWFHFASQIHLPLNYAGKPLLLLTVLCMGLLYWAWQLDTVVEYLLINTAAVIVMALYLHFSRLFSLHFVVNLLNIFNRKKAKLAE